MKQKLIFAAALLLLCTPLLTACSGGSKPDSSAGSSSGAQNSASSRKDPAEGVKVKETAEDLKEANNTLSKFFDACRKGNDEAIRAFSNVSRIPEFSAVAGVELTAEEAQSSIEGAIETYSKLESYEIGEGSLNKAAIGTYAGYLAEAQQIGAFLRENGDGAIADAADKLFGPIEKIYSFEVTVTKYDANNTDKMYVIQTGEDEWKVDLGMLQAMVDYMSVSKVKNANGEAKRAAEAVEKAISELDGTDVSIKKLNGEYHFDGDQLVSADGKTELSEQNQAFAEKLRSCYDFGSDMKISHLYFSLEKGTLKALSVQKDFSEIPYYGTWPQAVEEHYMYYFANIDDAMLFAADENASAAPF